MPHRLEKPVISPSRPMATTATVWGFNSGKRAARPGSRDTELASSSPFRHSGSAGSQLLPLLFPAAQTKTSFSSESAWAMTSTSGSMGSRRTSSLYLSMISLGAQAQVQEIDASGPVTPRDDLFEDAGKIRRARIQAIGPGRGL